MKPPGGGGGVTAVLAVDDGPFAASDLPATTEVGTAHTFRFRVTAGTEGIPEGAKVRLRVPGTFANPQRNDATAEGYVTAKGPEGEALATATWVDAPFEHEAGTEGRVVEATLAAPLASGETVDVVYGDTSGGSFGARVSFLARSAFDFEVSVDTDGDGAGTGVVVGTFPVETTAGEPVGLTVAAPATLSAGESAPVRAAAMDLLGNPAEGVSGAITCAWTRGEEGETAGTITLAAGEYGGDVGQSSFTAPLEAGAWRLGCTHGTLPVQVLGTTVVRPPGEGYRMAGAGGSSYLLWGDLHIHSSVSSDTDGASDTPDTLYVRARNSATLDFAAISDHDKGGIDDGSWVTDAIEPANDRHVDGTFVTLLGWEWTDADPEDAQTEGGHKIVYYLQGNGSSYCEDVNTACPTGATDPVEYFSNKNVPGDYKESCDLWEALAAQAADSDVNAQAITVPHHVATQGLPPRTAWDTVPDDCAGSPSPTRGLQSLVELFSDHGSSEGWNGASPLPIEDEAECDADPDRTVQAAQEYRWGDSSEEPHFLGVIASGDSHYGRPGQDPLPRVGENNTGAGTAGVGIKCGGGSGWRWREGGLAAVWVEAASRSAAIDRAALFESLKRRRTYGTTGSRIQLTFYLTDDTGGSDTLIDQGGAPPSGATDYDDPEYDIAGASGHNTELNFTDICPGSGTLDTVRLFHGWDDAGTWTWDVRKTWTSADFDGAGCLVGKTLNLIVGGTVNAANLKSGKNVYYVKVKETDTKPIRVASGRNKLRLTPDGGSPSDCTLSTGSWLPAVYVTSGQLATDLEGCFSGLDFTVTYNADPLDPYRFVISADDEFAMDGDSDAAVKATMAMLGFAQVDRAGALSHEGDDQVQSAANAEFAWSSPIWVDYAP